MKLVICEGKDDAAVLSGLCLASGIEGLTIEVCGGRDNLERYIRDLPVRPEFSRKEVVSLAVIIDAETDATASWQKVCNAISMGFSLSLEAPGIFLGESPRISAYIIPGGKDRGMLEDLCLEAVSNQPEYSCLVQYFECLSEKTGKKDYHSKAKFRAWMASQPEFGLYVGLAAGKGYIPWDSPAFEPVREVLRNL